jgi:peptidoglycan/xylan/chitin deacetylase (PgdA/CDA1 family)
MSATVTFTTDEVQAFGDLLYRVADELEAIESATNAHRKYGAELKEVAAEMLMRARAV